VCGDRAIGYNFGALTCESCRTFFRRNASRVEIFVCPLGNNCVIKLLMRKCCKKCRIDKCFAIGMKKKRVALKCDQLIRDENLKNVNTTYNPLDINTNLSNDFNEINKMDTKIPSFIKGFIFNFNELEMNRFKELFNSVAVVRNRTVRTIAYETVCVSDALQILQNRADIKFALMVKMSTNINGFKELCENDKIVLLKAGCPQIMFLLNIRDYDFEGQFWTIPIDNERATILRMSVMKGWNEIVVQIHKKFLLQQKTYMYLLQRYLEIKHNSKSESETRFGRLTIRRHSYEKSLGMSLKLLAKISG
ncbi:unnamed protein product, partial [Medioppia subpectinata]